MFKKVYTLDEVLKSAYVCTPLRLYEICPVSTGAAAVIVTADKQLISKADKPVKINATTMGSAMYGDPTIRISAVSCPAVPEAPMLSESYSASQQAYKKAGIGPEDVDLLELPDNSSWHYLVYLETCQFCKEGEADKMLRDGETKLNGRLPVNPERRIFFTWRGAFGPGALAGHRMRQSAPRKMRRAPGEESKSGHGPDLRPDGQQRHYDHVHLRSDQAFGRHSNLNQQGRGNPRPFYFHSAEKKSFVMSLDKQGSEKNENF